MLFRTELQLSPAARLVAHSDPILSVGSCFADRMSSRLRDGGFSVCSNPFGVLFHPLPMLEALNAARENRLPHPASVVQKDGRWVSTEAHSALWASSPDELHQHWQQALQTTRKALEISTVVLVTFGTAKGYWHPPTGRVAANCHKLPPSAFEPRMSTAAEISAPWIEFLNSLPGQPLVILTVSPVRHTRDTLPVNSLSKALLRVACEEIVQACPQAVYFPAYEMLTDDLRDYRFYADDMVHPSPVAEQYIWEKFCGAMMSASTQALIRQREGLLRDLAHRPADAQSAEYQKFLQQLYAKAMALKGQVAVDDVIAEVQAKLGQ